MATARHRWVLGGGLASGKSKVRDLLEREGILTIDADSVGRAVIGSGGPAFREVAERWPGVVDSGEIDRSALAKIVFTDREELAALEAITHPYIFGRISRQVEELDSGVVVEIPLLNHGLGPSWRRLVVDSSDPVRVERSVLRGGTMEDARARMAAQPSRAQWLAAADAVIPNHTTVEELRSTVRRFIPKL